ncbi:MAG: hypothetical protein IPL93_08830 [Actinomycetales bacterium]|nr:hypothetical protein [Actinomycetales bacterium]
MPRGMHVTETVVTRLREQIGLPRLTPAHRLDRLTSGVLLLTTEQRWRGAYQQALPGARPTRSTSQRRRRSDTGIAPSGGGARRQAAWAVAGHGVA